LNPLAEKRIVPQMDPDEIISQLKNSSSGYRKYLRLVLTEQLTNTGDNKQQATNRDILTTLDFLESVDHTRTGNDKLRRS